MYTEELETTGGMKWPKLSKTPRDEKVSHANETHPDYDVCGLLDTFIDLFHSLISIYSKT